MGDLITVSGSFGKKDYPKGTILGDIADDFQKEYKNDIILAKVNGKLRELFKHLNGDAQIEFVTTGEKIGHQTYARTATMLLTKAVADVVGTDQMKKLVVHYSVSKGYYCELGENTPITQELLDQIKCRMDELVALNLPIRKRSVSTDEAIDIFRNMKMYDKENLFRYRRASKVNIYNLDGMDDYNYGYMARSTGCIKYYDLYRYDDGFVLQLPQMSSPDTVEAFEPSHKLFQVLKQSTRWGQMLDVRTVGDLNDVIDDYFVDRERTPLDEFGKPNFECLGALDVDLFNEHMSALLRGERVELPNFNFITGKREYKGNYKQIGRDDILVIEGIHGLNDQLSYSIHKDMKFKIYISALTQLNVDEHNRIPTTDGRLIRRIVRDAAKRGASCSHTIAMWDSVRRGEEENIFPFQEEADAMFNSALIYELAVLKQYAQPQLFSIGRDAPEYDEAKRLLKFLDYFLGVSSENVPNSSILREFIGNGCFKV